MTSTYDSLRPERDHGDPPQYEEDVGDNKTSYVSRKTRLLAISALVFTLAAVSMLFLGLHSNAGIEEEPRRTRDECGLSPSEARQRGCIFDPVIMGWVPWRCYDANIANEFLARKSWDFYSHSDWNDTTPAIPLDEVLKGEWDDVYVPPEFYLFQCTYTWRKTWQAALNGGVLDGYLADDHHINHCEMLITKGPQLEKSVYMKYASCSRGYYNSGRFGWYRIIHGKKIYRANA